MPPCLDFDVGVGSGGGARASPPACVGGTLLTEPSPQLFILYSAEITLASTLALGLVGSTATIRICEAGTLDYQHNSQVKERLHPTDPEAYQ